MLLYSMPFYIASKSVALSKTTFTKKVSEVFGWSPYYESVIDNPYLNDFYKDMQRWSFNLQVYFLNSRFRQVIEIKEKSKKFIQDRTIYEDAFIFAPNLPRSVFCLILGNVGPNYFVLVGCWCCLI